MKHVHLTHEETEAQRGEGLGPRYTASSEPKSDPNNFASQPWLPGPHPKLNNIGGPERDCAGVAWGRSTGSKASGTCLPCSPHFGHLLALRLSLFISSQTTSPNSRPRGSPNTTGSPQLPGQGTCCSRRPLCGDVHLGLISPTEWWGLPQGQGLSLLQSVCSTTTWFRVTKLSK